MDRIKNAELTDLAAVPIQDSEESEAVDNAADDMEMVLEDLRNALEED